VRGGEYNACGDGEGSGEGEGGGTTLVTKPDSDGTTRRVERMRR